MSSAVNHLPGTFKKPNDSFFFDRAWSVTIDPIVSGGKNVTFSNIGEPDTLKVNLFAQKQVGLGAGMAWWNADVTIYNLNPRTEQKILSLVQGDMVTISAGYKKYFTRDGCVIFKGRVFQVMWERENVVDFRVTIRCLVGLIEDKRHPIVLDSVPGQTQATIVKNMAKAAHMQLDMDAAAEKKLSQVALPRGQAHFGPIGDDVQRIAKENGLFAWIDAERLNIHDLARDPKDPKQLQPDVVYVPPGTKVTSGDTSKDGLIFPTLIGTPQQIQEGVGFTVLMDSRLKLGSLVKLDMTAIRQLPYQMGVIPSVLDQSGMYIVVGLVYIGDTRGNEWYTEVTAVSTNWALLYSQGKQ
jgi:hypothetical protein